jgi:peptidoglycan LD-endopeptidase CwlK
MPAFSEKSKQLLSTCHNDLQRLFQEVVKEFDCIILCGHRNKADQDAAVASGNSKAPWPTSKHNSLPSMAIDVVPYPLDWNDRERMCYFAGMVKATAKYLGISITWGGDFNRNTQLKDEKLFDAPHFQID